MLDAADEFSTQVVTALHAARNSSGEILELGKDDLVDPENEWEVVVKDAFTHVGEAVDDVQARSARLHLLFGQDSLSGAVRPCTRRSAGYGTNVTRSQPWNMKCMGPNSPRTQALVSVPVNSDS